LLKLNKCGILRHKGFFYNQIYIKENGMKTLLKTFGIIAIAVIIGSTFTACGDDGGGGGGGGGKPIPLTENLWKEGRITSANGYVEYTFVAEFVPTYRIWWNDKEQGDGDYTGDIMVSAFRSNGDAIFTNEDHGWQTAKSYSAPIPSNPADALKTETIRIRVELKDKDVANAGSFAIVYSTGSSRPLIPPTFPAVSATTRLTAGEWKDGTIAADGEDWYSLSVTKDTEYYFWWNETGSNGNGTKTADIKVSAWYSNGAVPDIGTSYFTLSFTDRDSAWSSSVSFKAAVSGTVFVRVTPSSSTSPVGTYGIVYNTSSTRPSLSFNVSATPLTEAVWKDGEISDTDTMDWYSISVNSGSTYYLWWNERGTDGNGSKTANIKVSVLTNEGNSLSITDRDSSWSGTPASFMPTYAGTVYVRVMLYTSTWTNTYPGTYGIMYNTSNTKTTAPFNVPDVPLVENEWEDGNLPAANSTDWYSISVTSGTYYLWWNERGSDGNGTKTGDIYVSAYYSDGTSIFSQDSAWSTARTITASSTDTVYLKVTVYNNNSLYAGTYGIVYSTNTTRPSLSYNVEAIPLTDSKWEDGNLPTSSSVDWYTISVTSGTYRLWWNESGSYGNGTKTANVYVSAYYSDGSSIFSNQDTAWGTARTFTASSPDTVYVKVIPYGSNIGTYGIVYSTNTTRPPIPLDIPSTATSLTENVWKDGTLPTASSVDWYSISVTNDTTYRLWWNETNSSYYTYGNGSKTADVRVSIATNEGQVILDDIDDAWGNARSFKATYDGIYYVRVRPNSGTTTGTYGIVYSTSTTRPTAPFIIEGATPLVENQWKDANLPTANSVDWYSISVTSGTYWLWWNDVDSGDGTKTGDVKVSAYYSDGTRILDEVDAAWTTARSFTASSTDTVYVKVVPYGSSYPVGTYGIVYSTGTTRPTVTPTP
jgi:hypothetical protein